MLSTSATVRDCQQFVAAISQAGGSVPASLANILSGHDVLARPSPTQDPARTIVEAAVDGTLTAQRLTELITAAAAQQSIATYAGELRRNSERMFVDAFFTALCSGAADEIPPPPGVTTKLRTPGDRLTANLRLIARSDSS